MQQVQLLINKDGYIVHAGDLSVIKKKELVNVIIDGGQIKTITIEEYRHQLSNYKWIYECNTQQNTPK